MKLLSIASGSSGNCIYVGDEETHILIDAGISGKRIEAGLETIGINGKQLDGIFVTHEHIDHIAGIGVMARRYGMKIYGTRGTIEGIKRTKSVGAINDDLFQEITACAQLQVKDLVIDPLSISHDANEPVAYRVYHNEKRIGIITDLGVYSEEIVAGFQDMDAIFVEANHDVNMLEVGPYPYMLKRRILGERGHLSNETSGRFLCKLLNEKLKYIMLGHLSKENNMEELAYEAVRLEITMGDNPYDASDFHISVAKRNEPSQLIEV